ncbi:redoxin domain-containing protein [Xanthocytophaga agilis]|uniref:Alkyl hydroperoxide reductase C n=1 Tax=Xanthocytophaga agilis TaxID=3048010 RepID=A0AAE3RA11_9BACT|nr:redoxin domain-containing protein [Xanthocytophaga agilis]MDJ1506429.1 redoxin domain-containing protein [Xanthocytophaga agilis]
MKVHSDTNKLSLGELVPNFEGESQLGRVKLSDYRGRWLVFFSYPADFTPVCSSEVVAFSRIYKQLREHDCELVGLSTDSVATHRPWLESIETWMKESIFFPIIGDPYGYIARQYGMIMPDLNSTQASRSTFIIDPKQVLQVSIYYPLPVGRNTEEILRLIQALTAVSQQGKATPANWQAGDKLISLSVSSKAPAHSSHK